MTRRERIEWVDQTASGAEPLDLLRQATGDVTYVARPALGFEIAGAGAAAVVEARGADRFRTAARLVDAVLARVRSVGGARRPIFLGGFAFHADHHGTDLWGGYPALRLVLPRDVIVREGYDVVRSMAVGGTAVDERPAAIPSRDVEAPAESTDAWCARVRVALEDIRAGRLEKIVLSRSRAFRHVDFDPVAFVRHLRDSRPDCTTFFVRRGEAVFVGSTPETLVSVRDGIADTMALAGSMRVERGELPAEASARLLACPKNAAEHAHVATAVRAALGSVSDAVDEVGRRHVVRLPEMQHLATTYRARLRAGVTALTAAGALHPTPAVGGVPTAVAQARLARDESARGWYAGGVGWLDASGDGDWAVALRCALVRGSLAHAFAGAGIVAGSEPMAEWDETEGKMAAMLRLFTERARAA